MHGTFFPLRGRRQKRRHLSPSLPRGEPPHFRRKIMGLLMTLAPSSSRSTPRPPSLRPCRSCLHRGPSLPSRSEETLLFPTNVTCCQNQRRRRRRERERSRQLNSSKEARSPSLSPSLPSLLSRKAVWSSSFPPSFSSRVRDGGRDGRPPPPFCSQRTAAGAAEKECRTERLPQGNKFNKVSHSNRNTSLVKAPVKLFHIKKPT